MSDEPDAAQAETGGGCCAPGTLARVQLLRRLQVEAGFRMVGPSMRETSEMTAWPAARTQSAWMRPGDKSLAVTGAQVAGHVRCEAQKVTCSFLVVSSFGGAVGTGSARRQGLQVLRCPRPRSRS
jgi:hypothetical protein